MVAHGLSVVSRQNYVAHKFHRLGGDVLKHGPAIYHTVADMLVSPLFKSECKEFTRGLTILAKEDKSKWSVSFGSVKERPQQVVLDKWSDAIQFLWSVRSFDRERFIRNPYISGQSAPGGNEPLRSTLSDIFKAPSKFARSKMGLMSKTSKRRRVWCDV